MLEYGYIKLSRKIMSFWWYKELTTYKLFTHMLMNANYTEQELNGIKIPRGSLVSSYRALAKETGLSERQARTALNHLQDKNEITIESTHKFTIYTITHYESYLSGTENLRADDCVDSSIRSPFDGSSCVVICDRGDAVNDAVNDAVKTGYSDTVSDAVKTPFNEPILEGFRDYDTEKRRSKRRTDFSESGAVNVAVNDHNVINIKNNNSNFPHRKSAKSP